MVRRFWQALVFGICATALANGAKAQESGALEDIQVGSPRVRGGQNSASASTKGGESSDEDETALTEETLPPKGHPKRIPGLIKIASRYARAQMFKDACDRFDQILEESGDEAIRTMPDVVQHAARVYYECGAIESRNKNREKSEALLKKSERFGPSDYRHQTIRRQMQRDVIHEEVTKANWDKAISLFRDYAAQKPDEDERIWLGEQLAERAWAAYHAKDEMERERAIADAESIAPMNAELRRLKQKLSDENTGIKNAILVALGAALAVLALTQFFKWRARAKVPGTDLLRAGRKNKFLDEV